jgi:beta-galactosidase
LCAGPTAAGNYRDVWLLLAGLVHIAPQGLQVLTPEIDEHGAVIAVATEVRNRSLSAAKPLLRIEICNAAGWIRTLRRRSSADRRPRATLS